MATDINPQNPTANHHVLGGDSIARYQEARTLSLLKPIEYPLIDCHVHAVNFLQDTPGFDRLIEYMDRANITKSVVFGLPVSKIWAEAEREAPEYYLDDDSPCYQYSFTDAIIAEEYKKLSPERQERIWPLMCGFNPVDKHAIKHIERMYKLYPGVFRGIGETFFRHDDLTLLTYGETPRMNHAGVEPILEFISEYDLPFLVHNNISSTWTGDHPRYLYETEVMLRQYPKAKVVLCHCGASRRVSVPFYHHMVERLLENHEALHVDFSWIMFDEIICRDGHVQDEWYEFTEKFSNRILLGSDVIGNFHRIGIINARYGEFLSHLSPEARDNLCQNNANRLFGDSKNRVETNQKRTYPKLSELVWNSSLQHVFLAQGQEVTESMAQEHFRTHGHYLGVSLYDKHGSLRAWSSHMETLLGFSQEEALILSVNQKLTTTLYPDSKELERIQKRLNRVYERGGYYIDTFYPRHKNGHTVPLSYLTRVMLNDDGDIVGTLRIAFDASQTPDSLA